MIKKKLTIIANNNYYYKLLLLIINFVTYIFDFKHLSFLLYSISYLLHTHNRYILDIIDRYIIDIISINLQFLLF